MAAGDVRVLLNVDANDNVSAVIKQTNQVMRNFAKNAKIAGNQGTRSFMRIKGVVRNASTTFTEMNAKLQILQMAFQALRRVGEAAISGEIANNAESVFNQVIGSTKEAQEAMSSLRKSTRGIIDDTSLQVFASRLLIAGSQFKDVAGMAELAGKVALATGRDTSEVMQKLQDAILGGRQTEFRRLGTAIDLNKAIKEQIELEGRRIEDLEMSELISRRLALVTDKLSTAMDAAGINTAELSTNLRGLKADLQNLQSTAEQTLASALTPEKIEEKAGIVSKTVQRVLLQAGSGALTMIMEGGEQVGSRFHTFVQQLSKETGLTFKQTADFVKDAVLGFELPEGRAGMGFFDHQAALTEAGKIEDLAMQLAEQMLLNDRKRFQERQQAAKESLEAENAEERAAGKEKIDLKKEIHDMEVFFFQEKSNMSQEEIITLQSAIELEKINLKLMNEKIDAQEHELAILKLQAETQEKLEKLEKKPEKKPAKKGPSRSQIEARRKAERQRMLRAIAEENQIERTLQIEKFQRSKDLTIVHALQMEHIRKKYQEQRLINEDATFHELSLMETRQKSEEIRLINKQADELIEIEKKRQSKIEELQKQHLDQMKAMREEELQEFQKTAERTADALNLLQGPLIQLVDHEKGASEGLKVFGATMGATSEAANVYTKETDASADASQRLVQGLPSMISAGGASAAAFVKQTKSKALVQGGFETAASIASFATGDVIGGAGHAAAAAAFFAVAGKSGGKGKSSGFGTKTGELKSGGGGSGMTTGAAGSSITVNVQGFALGSAVDMGASLGRTIDSARHTGLGTSEV